MYDDPINARYDLQTIAIMKRALSRNSNCVDVGSSVGVTLWWIVQLCPDGTHYAFEPRLGAYKRLVDSFPSVNVYDLALSDTAGEASFHQVISNPDFSGFRKREYSRQHETIEVVQVKTELLDRVIPESLPVHFIKIDVEGAELQVLRGAVNTIRKNKPIIVFEHGLGAADYYGTAPEEVYDLLTAQCGLHVSLMEGWLKGSNPLRRKEFTGQFYQNTNFMFVTHP